MCSRSTCPTQAGRTACRAGGSIGTSTRPSCASTRMTASRDGARARRSARTTSPRTRSASAPESRRSHHTSWDRISAAMDEALAGHAHAKTALDVACWDLFGKSVGMPVCELLGGRTEVQMPVISSIHTGDPEEMRRRVAEHRDRGYTAHSVKIDDDPALNAARIAAAVSDRRPGELFLVDANGGMTVESALRMLRLLPPGLDFVLEAPCATWRECVALRRRTDVAICWDELATDESAIAKLIA